MMNDPKPKPVTMETDVRYAAAAEYIRRLTGDENTPVTFQVFDDTPAKDERKARIYHGTLKQHFERLTAHNNDGCGIFCTVNETDLNGRGRANITGVRAILADDDDGLNRVDSFPLRPHMAVLSSRSNGIEKKHFYWCCDGNVDGYDGVINRLVQDFKTCAGAKLLNQVLRVPGFYHKKDPNNPQLVEIVHMTDDPPYPWTAIVKAFPPIGNGHKKASKLHEAFNSDPVLNHLRAGGFVKEECPDGKIHIVCPFEESHTEKSSVSSTTYFVAFTNGYKNGHFKCQHAHCAHRTRADFLTAIGYATGEPAPQNLSEICSKILSSSEAAGDFDISKMPSVLRDYVAEICKTTAADQIMVLQSVLCAASSVLKKKIYLPEGEFFQQLYPNLYCLTIASSGGFKTTALNKGMRLSYDVNRDIIEEIELHRTTFDRPGNSEGQTAVLQERIKLLEKQNPLLPTRMTPEAMLEDLGNDMGGGIVLSELGEWLANMNKGHLSDFKGLITSFYDSPPFYQYKTRNRGDYIINFPFITINSVSTLQWVAEHLKPSDVESGFFARFLIFYPPRKPIMPPALPEDRLKQDHSKYIAFKSAVTSVKEPIAFVLDESAKSAFRKIHAFLFNEYLGDKHSDLLEPYLKRWGPYVLKLAMLMQVMAEPGSSRITATAIDAGYSVVEYAIRSTLYLLKEHFELPATAKKEQRVVDFIAKRGGKILRHQLQSSHILDGGSKEYDDVIASLIDQNRLINKPAHNNKRYDQYILVEVPENIRG